MSPEHPLIEKMKDSITNYDEVLAYKTEAAKKSEFERTELAKEKTGVKLEGIYAVNPANGAKLPVFISVFPLCFEKKAYLCHTLSVHQRGENR